MFEIRKSVERGAFSYGWLDTRHTFSFSRYYDEKFMGFGVLRVINEDIIKPGSGFGTHPHKDVEIITYVIEGAIEHKDSLGNKTVLKPGEIQIMTAGTGVEHSECNFFKDKDAHILQVWLTPENEEVEPHYDQKSFTEELKITDIVLVASGSGRDNSINLNQDADIYVCKAQGNGEKNIPTFHYRKAWVQVIKGEVWAQENLLEDGDGVGIEDTDNIVLKWSKGAEFLVFDLP